MAPTTDGVDFGVVENKQAGKAVLVYLKDNNPAEDEDATSNAPEAKPELAHPEGTVAEDATVTVTKDGVVLWQGPGKDAVQSGTANNGDQLKISATITIDGTVWGKVEDRGWLVLGDTDYDEVIKKRNSDNNMLMIIIAAGAAVVVIAVVVIVVVASKKKKKVASAKPVDEETTEE